MHYFLWKKLATKVHTVKYCRSLLHRKMSTTSLRMTKVIIYLSFGNASYNDLVMAIFIKIRIILIEMFDLNQKITLILYALLRWNFVRNQVENHMCTPGHLAYDKLLIGSQIDGPSREIINSIWDKWSTTIFSTPFLSLIVISNSYNKRIHLIKQALVFLLEKRYLREACSINTIIGKPIRHEQNLSNVKKIASKYFSIIE